MTQRFSGTNKCSSFYQISNIQIIKLHFILQLVVKLMTLILNNKTFKKY